MNFVIILLFIQHRSDFPLCKELVKYWCELFDDGLIRWRILSEIIFHEERTNFCLLRTDLEGSNHGAKGAPGGGGGVGLQNLSKTRYRPFFESQNLRFSIPYLSVAQASWANWRKKEMEGQILKFKFNLMTILIFFMHVTANQSISQCKRSHGLTAHHVVSFWPIRFVS